jgi:hypothetical protein
MDPYDKLQLADQTYDRAAAVEAEAAALADGEGRADKLQEAADLRAEAHRLAAEMAAERMATLAGDDAATTGDFGAVCGSTVVDIDRFAAESIAAAKAALDDDTDGM